MTIKLGDFTVPTFDGPSVAFGADRGDYPKYEDIPEHHRNGGSPECKAFNEIFFGCGVGITNRKMREGFDEGEFGRALSAFVRSFAPKHEVKEATCAWLIETCTELK